MWRKDSFVASCSDGNWLQMSKRRDTFRCTSPLKKNQKRRKNGAWDGTHYNNVLEKEDTNMILVFSSSSSSQESGSEFPSEKDPYAAKHDWVFNIVWSRTSITFYPSYHSVREEALKRKKLERMRERETEETESKKKTRARHVVEKGSFQS